MKYKNYITALVFCIVVLSLVATSGGIFTSHGPGPYEYKTIRGETVMIYGKGIYQHMTLEVAPQGIAQDVVTMIVGVPLLIISLIWARKGSLRGRLLLSGTLGYFLVTYLFYLTMGMYNVMFLVYVVLLMASFYAFLLTLLSFNLEKLPSYFNHQLPVKLVGGFLIFQALMIGSMWLSRVVPPLIEGRYPVEVAHYTTLIVQGLDLSLLLPTAILSGILLIRKNPFGYLLAPTFLNFLAVLMTALTGKLIGQTLIGAEVGGPVLVIIPAFNLLTILCSYLVLKNVNDRAAHN